VKKFRDVKKIGEGLHAYIYLADRIEQEEGE
jgi:hypothetical protein